MPTWNELREFARTRYELEPTDGDDWFSLVLPTGDDRSQRILVNRYEAYDREWVAYRSFVCKESEMSPRVALRHNADLALGALALDEDGDYMLTYQAPLATLDQDEFTLPLEVLPAIADQFEKAHTALDDY
ncbi:YbjN domain-containing protein [Actinoplanes solisilvae]|uniref:YbjN domain-containing protein n=1 Tax=Actinoplanes solisilvae TaxID=2486853 RepID=UPI000FD7A79B|nr:YbjN domain-containing protein [Actinoplanes solisilvae]